MVSNAYQRDLIDTVMATIPQMAAAPSRIYDLIEDPQIAVTSRQLAAALEEFREAIRLHAIRNRLA